MSNGFHGFPVMCELWRASGPPRPLHPTPADLRTQVLRDQDPPTIKRHMIGTQLFMKVGLLQPTPLATDEASPVELVAPKRPRQPSGVPAEVALAGVRVFISLGGGAGGEGRDAPNISLRCMWHSKDIGYLRCLTRANTQRNL